MSRIEEVAMYRTPDGRVHADVVTATGHLRRCDHADRANAVLDGGGSVLDALRCFEFWADYAREDEKRLLSQITKYTVVDIPHWNHFGFRVVRFDSDARIHLSNSLYSSDVHFSDLSRYYAYQLERMGGRL